MHFRKWRDNVENAEPVPLLTLNYAATNIALDFLITLIILVEKDIQ